MHNIEYIILRYNLKNNDKIKLKNKTTKTTKKLLSLELAFMTVIKLFVSTIKQNQ